MATSQPTPSATSEDVDRIVRRDYPPQDVPAAIALLERYASPEPHRVRLAALKIAAGDLRQLERQIELAGYDYRDVLSVAEYPENTRRWFSDLGEDERREIYERDWRQYQAWFSRGQ